MTSSTLSALPVGTSSPSKYPAILQEAWQQHLAIREIDAPTVISLFAGCGGSSLGYSMAGFRELLAVEWNNNAVETFRLNFPNVPVYHGDIVKLSIEEVLQRTGLAAGQLDVLDGSPPCQGFSTAGKRIMDDSRNNLFREYVRLLRGLRPKVFVMENVSGMIKGKMKLLFVEILRELKASRYRVSARLLNAMWFNVPQSRDRMIFIGVREDLGIESSHPRAERKPWTVAEAWKGTQPLNYVIPRGEIARRYERIKPGGSADIGDGRKFNTKKLSFDRPSQTLPRNVGASFALHLHPNEFRSVSIEEAKRIASFPDAFQFDGEYCKSWACIGNSVPPLLMRSIARHIRQAILIPTATFQETANA